MYSHSPEVGTTEPRILAQVGNESPTALPCVHSSCQILFVRTETDKNVFVCFFVFVFVLFFVTRLIRDRNLFLRETNSAEMRQYGANQGQRMA